MSDSTRMSAVNSDLSSNLEERMQSPQNLQGQQDGKALVSYRKCGIALSFSHSHGYLRARNWDVIFRRKDEKDKL
uniref:Uncharacterized protein n=1 Tax=Accipiter nisus TaxID=211598 RepID=A0A8B9M520_9AVES